MHEAKVEHVDAIGNKRENMKLNSLKKKIIVISCTVVGVIAILLTLVPWYGSYLQNKSLKEAENGYQVDALHTAESALSFNPISIQSLFVLAGAQQRIGRQEEARTTLIKATELQPLNYITWEQLAIYERDRWNEPEKAKEHFEKAISLNPHDSQLLIEAGVSQE